MNAFEEELEQAMHLADMLKDMSLPDQIKMSGSFDPRIIEAFKQYARFTFIEPIWAEAGLSRYLSQLRQITECARNVVSLAEESTSSMPSITAQMIDWGLPVDKMELKNNTAFEIGSGCGYAAAILGQLFGNVHAFEIQPALARISRKVTEDLGIHNVEIRDGDGFSLMKGSIREGSIDTIILSAAFSAEKVKELYPYLADGGRIVYPQLDDRESDDTPIYRVTRIGDDFQTELMLPGATFVLGR